ncbi:HAD-IIIA family hydrolase [Paenibacillus campinasensis]|uniref:KdsC family phosphatase n=1 Tax=Paenibacillus campinasensis TaxID=66347 RepID=UPI002E7C0F53|nr:HAD-IIIA family hydrolase [Paenibacillus campinasensis]
MLPSIKLICLDVDGTLTDGTIYIGSAGEVFKGFNVKDGMGIYLAQQRGVQFAIITGRESEIVERRAKELNITHIFQNCGKKDEIIKRIKLHNHFNKEEIAFIGDDVNDVVVRDEVGLFVVVGDGHPKAKKVADIVLRADGGKGAVREFIDQFILNDTEQDGAV